MEQKSEWQNPELTEVYLNGVRGTIPGADLQLAVIGKIVDLWCASPKHILDLGCGNGILGHFLLNRFPSSNGLFVDFSDPMLDAARKKVETFPKAIVVKGDFASPQWLDVTNPLGSFDIVVSGFAIHHQPNERKRELYSEIFDLLTPGGVFLNLEHVASITQAGEELFDDFFIDHLHHFHSKSNTTANRDSIADKYYRRLDKKENILARVEDQCQWLRHIGYTDVDCFFKVFELALFGGRKASNKANSADTKSRAAD
ncbi:MAG: class I SAM-dependent methyltransferase [gamma proteobacterium symbiont of Taylorina sp.]|nr:class I SAM-dependent methyltransferase [gamma proteobacterium symbiont of Taylorina sp.]